MSRPPSGQFSRSPQAPCRFRPLPRRGGSEDLARLTHPRAPRRLIIGLKRLKLATADAADESLEHGGRHTRENLSKPLNPPGADYGSPLLVTKAANRDGWRRPS
jgi:hypothetical protein